ncbi:MAG: amino acid ABC transporter permease [Arthrobacter sp.]|uniref:amino acid ABC transporter permease n=1 Tax=unclassified Arthrobacter TaxID=235627 RepID=UPI0026571551|nr:amino acid ABC transporter permease [Micrococcaceae bacterium]MDN5812056.1 amino acid ABC transporter permease [Micrococcaceae bacterium]MDN5825272.1 amino acid ABC transporter permease [Micrococcaceae bacterium]MDN5879189.1 amino acid ABC transporter permease [Micrococcaceae bacterium]MDN5886580.1 amino acid ABC transporter permease [Micrococcaceae bacterium]
MSASVLFDTPGPKARRNIILINILGAVVIVAVLWWTISGLAAKGQMAPGKWDDFLEANTWVDYLLPGLANTLKAAALAIVGSVVFGLIFGIGRLSKNKLINVFCSIIVEFFRSVPVLLMIVFFNIFFSRNLQISSDSAMWAVVAALVFYNGSVVAELIRSGVRNLPKGQREAGTAIGLTTGQCLRAVEIPQALVAMLPALISQFVVILKDSALGYIISFNELLFYGRTYSSPNGNVLQALIVVAAVFIIINFALSKLATIVSRRLSSRGETKTKPGARALVGAPAGLDDVEPGGGAGGRNQNR